MSAPSHALCSGRLLRRAVSLGGSPVGAWTAENADKEKEHFTRLPTAVETVSTFLEKGGAWRAAGYFIKPSAQ